MFTCILPCGFLCFKAQKRWAARFLDRSNERVRRVDGIVKDKMFHKSHEGGSSMSVVLEFQAARLDSEQVSVRAQRGVSDFVWSRVRPGSIVEIVYVIGNERDFAIVEDLEYIVNDSCTGQKKIVCYFLGFFAIIGVAMTFLMPLTGCYLGLVPFLVLVLGGAIVGNFGACFRICSGSCLFVTTSGGPTMSEKLYRGLADLDSTLDRAIVGRNIQSLESQRQEREWLQLRATQMAHEADHEP